MATLATGLLASFGPGRTYTRWIPFRGFTVSSSVPPLPRFSQRDNEAGRCQEVSSSFFASLNLFLFSIEHTRALAQERALSRGIFFRRRSRSVFTLLAQPRIPSSLRCGPPNISSILTDHDEVFELPG